MRQRLGERKLKGYSRRFGMAFDLGLTRGNNDHAVMLRDTQGRWWLWLPRESLLLQDEVVGDQSRPREGPKTIRFDAGPSG